MNYVTLNNEIKMPSVGFGVFQIPEKEECVRKERMLQNIDIFNFELNEDDMNKISCLDKKESSFFNHQEASSVEMLASLVR
ncbi:MAG: hypothetical protein E6583_06150 [Clostridium sp.]|nr:hypothetical protein [Clostridium sp.]